MNDNLYTIISYYKFIKIENIFKHKNIFNKYTKDLDCRGIILIAPEGINLNLSMLTSQSKIFIKRLSILFKFLDNELKISYSNKHIFRKLKIKVKEEILTTRLQNQINLNENIGDYINPTKWDNFIKEPDVILVDTRNFYENEVGTFSNAVNPNARNFTELLIWLDKNILNKKNKKKKIAMFCTGGIRCEKATSYLKVKGHANVFHLEGGILKYLEKIKGNNSWVGECFVFDDRVTVDKNLNKGTFELCFACRMPLSKTAIKNKKYIKGVSCHKCHGTKTQLQIDKYSMRNKQLKKINNHER
tara:strand:- start:2256 stop:3161 length:906 start_codon:yes stop_codon:yes gene_type:complete